MIKIFPIDFVREIITTTLYQEKVKKPELFGGDNEIFIESFYSQLKQDKDIDRFVDTFEEIVEQQNRSGLIGSGVVLAPENPTITNLYSAVIIPLTYTCNIRCNIGNRYTMIDTINNLIECLKGRKVDIAQLRCETEEGVMYYLFMVGTMGEEIEDVIAHKPTIVQGDFIGNIVAGAGTLTTKLNALLTSLSSKGLDTSNVGKAGCKYFYADESGKIVVVKATESSGSISWQKVEGGVDDFAFPPEHTSYERYKVSLSFESIRCDTPRTLNAQEVVEISFGGSATIVNDGVELGNDMVRLSMKKHLIKAQTDITPSDNKIYFVEPLEMPSGNNANAFPNSLISNKMIANSQTDGLALSLQYTFIADMNISLLKQFFLYGRYGIQNTLGAYISPNLIFEVKEYWSAWGNFETRTFYTKIIESIDIENTESDTMTILVPMQIQGANQ